MARVTALFACISMGLAACSVLRTPAPAVVYDFGPGLLATAPAATDAALPAVLLADVEAPAALESAAILYRLSYSDSQQLRPYAQARWSMPPAQLVHQRLREQLGLDRAVLLAGQGLEQTPGALTLRVELEEFSQLFSAADRSTALLRWRATLGRATPAGERLLAQRSFVVQQATPSADAPGGARAMAQAVDTAIAEMRPWMLQASATAR